MNQFIKQTIRNSRFQDAMGVLRGLAKVNSRVLERTNHMSSDLQRFSKNVEQDLEFIQEKIEETADFIKAATETLENPVGEFVTFEKQDLDLEEEKLLYEEEKRRKREEERKTVTFKNINDLEEDHHIEEEEEEVHIDLGNISISIISINFHFMIFFSEKKFKREK